MGALFFVIQGAAPAERLSLAPGESRTVTFKPGRYEVRMGSGQPDTGVAVQSAGFQMTKAVAFNP